MYYYPVLKLIFVIYNLGRLTNNNTKKMELLIIYSFDGCFICYNNWQNKYYLTKAFIILFLF